MKLVHASTTASSLSAMLEKHSSTHSSRSTRSSRLARQSRTCRVELRRAKWNLGFSLRTLERFSTRIPRIDKVKNITAEFVEKHRANG